MFYSQIKPMKLDRYIIDLLYVHEYASSFCHANEAKKLRSSRAHVVLAEVAHRAVHEQNIM